MKAQTILPLNVLLNYWLLIWGNHPDRMQNQPLNQMDNQHAPVNRITCYSMLHRFPCITPKVCILTYIEVLQFAFLHVLKSWSSKFLYPYIQLIDDRKKKKRTLQFDSTIRLAQKYLHAKRQSLQLRHGTKPQIMLEAKMWELPS